MSAIDCQGLGKRFGRNWALTDCRLSVPAGRSVALVGPNGAGKTTLLHMAVGLTRPTTGAITVLDRLAPGSDRALASVGFVAQDTPLYANLSVADTLRMVAHLNDRFDTPNARHRLVEFDVPLSAKLGRLSGGQRAQVALAVALARHPQLLILDEPVARLDPLARHEFMGTLMAAVAEEGMSVLFSSHVVAELERVCDYLIVLSRGRVQVDGSVESLMESHRLVSGPADQAGDVAARHPVVYQSAAGRQCRLLLRGRPPLSLPPGWQDGPTNLEELILCYLRSPEATSLSGPVAAGRVA